MPFLVGQGTVRMALSPVPQSARLPKIELGERRLHWLKNLSRPIAAHVATERACGFGALEAA